jgi:MFS family permease
MGFTHNWRVLAFLRFLLGIFEGGMLPGMVYIISSWYVFSSSKFFLGTVLSLVLSGTAVLKSTGESAGPTLWAS